MLKRKKEKKQVAAQVLYDAISIHLTSHETIEYNAVDTYKWNKSIETWTGRIYTKFRTEVTSRVAEEGAGELE